MTSHRASGPDFAAHPIRPTELVGVAGSLAVLGDHGMNRLRAASPRGPSAQLPTGLAPVSDAGGGAASDDDDPSVRNVVPVPDGTAPLPSAVDRVDWSAGPAEAAVGRLIGTANRVDRVAAQLVADLIQVVESGATETVLGVAVEIVLSQSCRMVGFERRTLLRAATTLVRMPATRHAFAQGWMSWSQVRAVLTAVRPLRIGDLAVVDDRVADLAVAYADCEADALVVEIDWFIDRLLAQRAAERDVVPVVDNRVVVTPRLDGSGTLYGEFDSAHFVPLVQAIDNHTADRHPDSDCDTDDTSVPDQDVELVSDAALTAAHAHAAAIGRRHAVRRGLSLFELVTGCDATTFEPFDHDRATGRPSVLVTCHIDTLLGGTTPAWLLTTLAGRMKADAATMRAWMNAQGVDVRLIAMDNVGEVVGVGRRARFATGWLRDAIIARDLHDTAPCSTTPATVCDIDHITDWVDGGRTDVDNLTLLSTRFNQAKRRGDWHLTRHPNGTRTWTARSGYRIHQPPPPHHPSPAPPAIPTPTHGPAPP